MKIGVKYPFIVSVLAAFLGLMLAGRVTAQTFTVLHSFTGSDGANPYAGLILSGNTLYGVASQGGTSGNGTVFAVGTNSTGFTNLHNFSSVGTEGANPLGDLLLSGGTMYGTTISGGGLNTGSGTVFALNTDGTDFTNLLSLDGTIGDEPSAGLVLGDNILYGTTTLGGDYNRGTVFAVKTDGSGVTNLYSFESFAVSITNSIGASPIAGLILSGSTLYGTAQEGGGGGYGTVFAIKTDGSGVTNLHSFEPLAANSTNSEGAEPVAGLILSGNKLYGTAAQGGSWAIGTVFAVNTDGTGFKNLYSFTYGDGANPSARLTLSGNTLYGTAQYGGSSGNGTIFAINIDGTGFRNLYSFTSLNNATNSDGTNPREGLILSGNTLYGTTYQGGSSGVGTVFSIFIQPQLTIVPLGPYVILTWPTNYAGFTLQSTTNLSSPVWSTNSPAPVIVNGQNTVTNPISGTQQFFRLVQ